MTDGYSLPQRHLIFFTIADLVVTLPIPYACMHSCGVLLSALLSKEYRICVTPTDYVPLVDLSHSLVTVPFFFFSPTQWLQHPLALLHLPCPPPKRTFDSRASLDHNVGMRVRVCRACRAESQRVAKRTTEWPAQAYTGSPPPLHP